MGILGRAFNELLQNIIPVAPSLLDGVARDEPIAVLVEELAGKGAESTLSGDTLPRRALILQLLLDPLPEIAIKDRLVLSLIALRLMPDVTDIDRIGEKCVERTTREGLAPPYLVRHTTIGFEECTSRASRVREGGRLPSTTLPRRR
jgi:hypothetical protein